MKSLGWLIIPVIAIVAILALGGEDESQAILRKTTYAWVSGPEKSVTKLENLYDIDMLMIKVANLADREIIPANITLLDGWAFEEMCRDADACFYPPNNIYLPTGWSISNMTGLPLAHEISHLYYPDNNLAADQISCAIFPEFDECYNILPVIR